MQDGMRLVHSGWFGNGCCRIVWNLYVDEAMEVQGPDIETGIVYSAVIQDRNGKELQRIDRLYETTSGWRFVSKDGRCFCLDFSPLQWAKNSANRASIERMASLRYCRHEPFGDEHHSPLTCG